MESNNDLNFNKATGKYARSSKVRTRIIKCIYLFVILSFVIVLGLSNVSALNIFSNNNFSLTYITSNHKIDYASSGLYNGTTINSSKNYIGNVVVKKLNQTWLDFNGSTDYVNILDNGNYSPINNFNNQTTFFIKFKRDPNDQTGIASNGRQYLFDKGGANRYEYSMFVTNMSGGSGGTSAIYFQVFNTSSHKNEDIYVLSVGGVNGNWYHSAIIINGSKMYGYHEGKYTNVDNFVATNDTISNITLGKGNSAGGEFNGSISDFKIYSSILGRASLQTVIDETDNFQAKRIPIIMYHTLCNSTIENVTFCLDSVAQFKTHLDFLNTSGYTTITDVDLYNASLGLYTLPSRPIILTFDDALNRTIEMADIMKNYSFKGVIAPDTVLTNGSLVYVSNGYLTWAQLKTLVSPDFNWTIASHSDSHCYMDELSGTGGASSACNVSAPMENNLSVSKQKIQNHAGVTPLMFIHPYNSWGDLSMGLCSKYYKFCLADALTYNVVNYIDLNMNWTSGDADRVSISNSTTIEQINEALNFSFGLESLVGNWKFNANQGLIVYDNSTIGNNANISGATWNNDGIYLNLTHSSEYSYDTIKGLFYPQSNYKYSWLNWTFSQINQTYQTFILLNNTNSSTPYTMTVRGLSNALIYYNNLTAISGNANGESNVTIPSKNWTYILDDYNVTEGVSRDNDPIWMTTSNTGTEKTWNIASNITNSLTNIMVIGNVDCTRVGTVTFTPKDGAAYTPTYTCTTNKLVVTNANINYSTTSNKLVAKYDVDIQDICKDAGNSFLESVALIGLLITVVLIAGAIGLLFASYQGLINLNGLTDSFDVKVMLGAVFTILLTGIILATVTFVVVGKYCPAIGG